MSFCLTITKQNNARFHLKGLVITIKRTNSYWCDFAPNQRNISIVSSKKEQARRKLRAALDKGILTRPSICEKCGKGSPPRKDGRSTIQGHHLSYDLPLIVEWLCPKCHTSETNQVEKGQKVSKALTGRKLTQEHKQAIRQGSLQNATLSIKNSSGYRGVCWNPIRKRWRATLNLKGKHLYLGLFKTKEEAAQAYESMRHAILQEISK